MLGIPDTSTFTFNKEDHTLGNMLTARLHQSQHVVFAAYKVPHPLTRYELQFLSTCYSLSLHLVVFHLRYLFSSNVHFFLFTFGFVCQFLHSYRPPFPPPLYQIKTQHNHLSLPPLPLFPSFLSTQKPPL